MDALLHGSPGRFAEQLQQITNPELHLCQIGRAVETLESLLKFFPRKQKYRGRGYPHAAELINGIEYQVAENAHQVRLPEIFIGLKPNGSPENLLANVQRQSVDHIGQLSGNLALDPEQTTLLCQH